MKHADKRNAYKVLEYPERGISGTAERVFLSVPQKVLVCLFVAYVLLNGVTCNSPRTALMVE
jgi:hypothetical protein